MNDRECQSLGHWPTNTEIGLPDLVHFHSSTVFNIKTNLPHTFLTFPSHKIFFFVVVSLVVMMASSFSSSFFITRPVLFNGRDSYCSISTPSRQFQITTTHLNVCFVESSLPLAEVDGETGRGST